jgi:hypothetical protein
MNWRKIKAEWPSYQAAAVREWPEVPPEALTGTHGDRTEMVRHLTDAYGWSLEEATLAADRWAEAVTRETEES